MTTEDGSAARQRDAERDRLLETLLHALYRRDADALTSVEERVATLVRELRASTVLEGWQPDARSCELGALQTLESLTVRAAARQGSNAALDVARRAGARRLMAFLGLARERTSTPAALARELKMQASNVSRLIAGLRTVGLIEDGADTGADARVRPIRLTDAGCRVLDRLDPGWEELGSDEQITVGAGDESDAATDAQSAATVLERQVKRLIGASHGSSSRWYNGTKVVFHADYHIVAASKPKAVDEFANTTNAVVGSMGRRPASSGRARGSTSNRA